jgi:hypothetical protein
VKEVRVKYQEQRYLERLEQEFNVVGPVLQKLIHQILEEGVTKYPILVASRQPIRLGLPVIDAEEQGLFWTYRVSPLEELVKKGLVNREQVERFREQYTNPAEKVCVLFIIPDTEEARFIFLPFQSAAASGGHQPGSQQ